MGNDNLLPEQRARIIIDRQLNEAGWEVVNRDEYIPQKPQAIREALTKGGKESDYLLFVDNKAIAVVEAKREENALGDDVAQQAESYANNPKSWYGTWTNSFIPLVYLANSKKIMFKNLLEENSEYVEIEKMHSPKKMLKIIKKQSEYGTLPLLEKEGLRDCQYDAEIAFEKSLMDNKNKGLAVLATGAGKTYLACLASYRLLNYTPVDRILFLVDRNNLARQTEGEFSKFDRTENKIMLNSLYSIKRLRKNEDIDGDIVISTIQKLFSVLTGKRLIETDDDDEEDEIYFKDYIDEPSVDLGDDITLPPDYFKFIIIDECHRSIYGKWKSVLDYFSDAKVLGLTATPTPEAYAYFNNNIIEKYTYEESVLDGVNVPNRIYEISTKKSTQGGIIEMDTDIEEIVKRTGQQRTLTVKQNIKYSSDDLDRTIIDKNQIRTVLSAYRDSIYTSLFPDREEKWEYIPKTLIFAKSDKHADEIIEAINDVFREKFADGIPQGFAQKITYSAGDSTQLIRDLNFNKNFRIAVTVTLVATGTDVKPLEVVMFMADVKSDVLYTQMKGRGCRSISSDLLKEVTPNADFKDCFYIVDAVGVTKTEKTTPRVEPGGKKKTSLKDLLEELAHGYLTDKNLMLLRDYCSTITNRYVNNALFGVHLDEFIDAFDFSPISISQKIQNAFDEQSLPDFVSPSEDNKERFEIINDLISNREARNKLLELHRGYIAFAPDSEDEIINVGFAVEEAQSFIDNFEKYIFEHKDSIEALRIIYNSEKSLITYSMLKDLQDKLLSENKKYVPYNIWKNYKRIDEDNNVSDLDLKKNVNALTNLIQIVRYAFKSSDKLVSLFGLYSQRFNLYVGSTNHSLTDKQIEVMNEIGKYIVENGSINDLELNIVDTNLWKTGFSAFGQTFASEMHMLSKYIIGVA